jgi:DNA-binding CsgD family transcriptional regulator
MKLTKPMAYRIYSIAGFAFIFAYLLSFLFEGQVLYGLLEHFNADASLYIIGAIAAHFAGLFTGSFVSKTTASARKVMIFAMGLCVLLSIPFYFPPSLLWAIGLITAGYVSGCAVAAWGFLLKAFTPKNERLRSCADVLILSNLLMIAINATSTLWSPFAALSLSLACIPLGCFFILMLPVALESKASSSVRNDALLRSDNPLWILALFVFIITINSGLMYQVINPAFDHLIGLVSWYWAVPYILALIILRSIPLNKKRSSVLYVGMAMIMAAYIAFMLLGRKETDYLIIDTLMLGACGIFDLFWWSILGEMLDHTNSPAKVFGIGLSANVLGVLCGGVLGMAVTSAGLPSAEIAVIALSVVCVTLVLLPPLNRRLVLLLKSHTYLAAYDNMSQSQQTDIIHQIKTLDPLTVREQEVLQMILSGKPNREIARALYISENTVKTHIRNIFSKYDVSSRVELVSTILKNQTDE